MGRKGLDLMVDWFIMHEWHWPTNMAGTLASGGLKTHDYRPFGVGVEGLAFAGFLVYQVRVTLSNRFGWNIRQLGGLSFCC